MEAKESDKARGTDAQDYESGCAMAYYEVMSVLVNQGEAFELSVDDLQLEGLDPDRDLL